MEERQIMEEFYKVQKQLTEDLRQQLEQQIWSRNGGTLHE